MSVEKKVRDMVVRAVRICADDDKMLGSFEQHEKTIIDNTAFLYWLIRLSELDEREACADICDQHASIEGIAQRCAEQIRARSKT